MRHFLPLSDGHFTPFNRMTARPRSARWWGLIGALILPLSLVGPILALSGFVGARSAGHTPPSVAVSEPIVAAPLAALPPAPALVIPAIEALVAPVPVAPPAVPAGAKTIPFPGTGATLPLNRLSTEAAGFLAGRAGVTGVAVYDARDGNIYGTQPNLRLQSASIIKVAIMATLLNQVQTQRRSLTAWERAQLTAMIQSSDNNAATALYVRSGGGRAMQAYLRSIGLTETQPNPAFWGLTYTTPADMVKLVAKLYFHQTLTPELCDYALGLMRGVIPGQRWGLSAGLPRNATVALKNGWYPETDGSRWRVHSIGAVNSGGKVYIAAVMTAYPQGLGMNYGQNTIGTIAGRIARQILGE